LGILFTASIIGYLVVRLRATEWPPTGSPGLPGGLWASTAILAIQSVLLVLATRTTGTGNSGQLSRQLAASAALGVAFLAAQVGNWMGMAAGAVIPRQSLFVFAFYVLTFLHALHVLGGIVPLVLTALRARGGRYTDDPEPIALVASYWHFLAATWVAIFIVLAI